jgi:hypothetical protein
MADGHRFGKGGKMEAGGINRREHSAAEPQPKKMEDSGWKMANGGRAETSNIEHRTPNIEKMHTIGK